MIYKERNTFLLALEAKIQGNLMMDSEGLCTASSFRKTWKASSASAMSRLSWTK